MGSSRDHFLIVGCFYFLDPEAQVSLSKLSPNVFYYLLTVTLNPKVTEQHSEKHSSDAKENEASS